MREELRYAIVASGVQFAMRDGRTKMQKWSVAKLDSELVVHCLCKESNSSAGVSNAFLFHRCYCLQRGVLWVRSWTNNTKKS